MKKKQIIVVKSLRVSSSPTRKLLVSRDPDDVEDVDVYTTSNLGNPSPKRPTKDKNGGILPRSILGDSSTFTEIENKALAETSAKDTLSSKQPTNSTDDNSRSPKRKLIKQPQKTAPVVAKPIVSGDMADDSRLYMSTLRDLQDKMTLVRTRTLEKTATLVKFLPIYEQTSLNKESAILANWQERQREWDRIQTDISSRVNAPKNHALMMSKTDEFRARTEEYEFLRASVPPDDRRNAENVFEWTLRANTVRSIPVGHMFTGLYTEVSDIIKPPVIMRKAKPISDLLARTNGVQGKVQFFEETPAMLAQKKKYARNLLTLRPRELSLEDASGLSVKSIDLFDWAVESSQEYFDIEEEIKNKASALQRGRLEARRSSFGGVFDRKRVKTPDERSASGTRRGSRRGSRTSSRAGSKTESMKGQELSVLDGPKILFLSPDEIVFSSKQGERSYQPITFKNTGTIAFAYEWNVLVDQECSNPPDNSAVGDLIINSAVSNSLPREHYLSTRSSIFCMKNKGKLLPGEEVSTLFAFNNNATVGALTETWLLNTIPRANIAMDPQAVNPSKTLNEKANKLHPLLLSALAATTSVFTTKPLEYDILSPLQVCIRGHTAEIDTSNFSRLKITETINADIKNTDSDDKIRLINRRLREPVKIQNIKLRKIKLFERINYELFGALGGPYGNGQSLIVTIERIHLFEDICNRINECLPLVVEELQEIKKKEAILFGNNSVNNDGDNNGDNNGSGESKSNMSQKEESKTLMTNKNPKELKRMFLELFPERVIESFDLVTKADIKPMWDYNITTLLQAIQKYVKITYEISAIFDKIQEREALQAKIALKEKKRLDRVALLDSDEEDEEEEEEEEDEAVRRALPPKPKHPSVLLSEAMLAECSGTLNLLLTHVLPIDQISSIARDVLCSTCDQFEDYKAIAKDTMAAAAAAGADVPSTQPVIITALPSPFTSPEGATIWAQIINPIPPPEAALGVKKVEKKKIVPGSAEDIEREKEFQQSQVNIYYKKMYELVSESLYESLDKMFSNVDLHMEHSATQSKERSLYAGESLFNVAVLREEDSLGVLLLAESSQSDPVSGEERKDEQRRRGSKNIEVPVQRGRIAFINFDGLPFTKNNCVSNEETKGGNDMNKGSEGGVGGVSGASASASAGAGVSQSAFDVLGQAEQLSLQPVIEAAIGGISAAVLLFESPIPLASTTIPSNSTTSTSSTSTSDSSNTDNFAVHPYARHAASRIQELLTAVSLESQRKSLKYRRNKKINGIPLASNPVPIVLFFKIVVCETFSDLNSQLKTIVNYQNQNLPFSDEGMSLMQTTAMSPFSTIRIVTVLILEDLRHPGVVPMEPSLPIVIEDDDEAPISIGGSEWEEMRMKQWEDMRPHRSNAANTGPDTEPCYTSVSAALSEAFSIASGRFSEDHPVSQEYGVPHNGRPSEKARFNLLKPEASFRGPDGQEAPVPPALWIEASSRSFFLSQGSKDSSMQSYNNGQNLPFLKTIKNALKGVNKHEDGKEHGHTDINHDERDTTATQRVVTKEIRETMLWMGIIQLMPLSSIFLSEIEELNKELQIISTSEEYNEEEKNEQVITLRNEVSPAAYHFTRIFSSPSPLLTSSQKSPLGSTSSPLNSTLNSGSAAQSLPGTVAVSVPPGVNISSSFMMLPVSIPPPRLTVVLGGSVRTDKFLALDNLIDSAHTILIVGEMCLPFCSYLRKISLRKCADSGYCNYVILCRNLLFKARSRGCRIILPEDFIMGDEEVTTAMTKKCYQTLDSDARDEGTEYEGECSVFTFATKSPSTSFKQVEVPVAVTEVALASANGNKPPQGLGAKKNSFTPSSKKRNSVLPVAEKEVVVAPIVVVESNQSNEPQLVEGFLYDLGPRSVEILKVEVGQADILFVWGTVGVCEMAPFQTGQRALITASSKIKQTSPSLSQKMAQLTIPPVIETKIDPKLKKNQTTSNPAMERTDSTLTKKLEIIVKYPRTLLVGDSTVEWYARVLDPDGQFEGDIVGAGRVAYATRKSDVPVGLLSLCRSSILDKGLLMKRLGNPLIFDPTENDGNLNDKIASNEWVYNTERVIVDEEEDEEEEEEEEDDDE